jgi:hypothetical protein
LGSQLLDFPVVEVGALGAAGAVFLAAFAAAALGAAALVELAGEGAVALSLGLGAALARAVDLMRR